MSSDVVLSVRNVDKTYTIRHNHSDHVTLAEMALERVRHPFRRAERERFEALHDISFEVRSGEVLGVVGRNGAGKSTILKILSRITEPTRGEVAVWGRVGSLLEVGTGFHPELTGRENVYLNGSMLGMSRGAIQDKFDEIVEFAGVEKFLDTPVKRYSSGMYVRLAFAVAAHLDSDILLLDEVLAVGDSGFQDQCMQRIEELRTSGRAVLLVSHQAKMLRSRATRAILLVDGHLHLDSDVDTVLDLHEELSRQPVARDPDTIFRSSPLWGKQARFRGLAVAAEHALLSGAPLHYSVDIDILQTLPPLRLTQVVYGEGGVPLATSFSPYCVPAGFRGPLHLDVEWSTEGLAPGAYSLGLVLGTGDLFNVPDDLDAVSPAIEFSVTAVDADGTPADWRPYWGAFHLPAPTITVGDAAGPPP